MKLSVIIVTYNSEEHIYDCLASLYRYNDLPEDELEVIVVDNLSKQYDAMREKLMALYPSLRIVQNTRNGGYGQGNNVGIRLASAPLVAVMNPDVRLTEPILSALVKGFEDEKVVMGGCKQQLVNGKQGWSFACDYAIWEPMRVILRNICLPLDLYCDRFMYLSGAFFVMRKEAFEKIGMFDEQLFMYGEEPDIYLRFKAKFPKMRIYYLSKLSYLHKHTMRPYEEKRHRNQIKGDLYVYRKHNISTRGYLCTHYCLSYIFQLRAFLKGNTQEIEKSKQTRKIFKELAK